MVEARTRQEHVEDLIVDIMPVGAVLATAEINAALRRILPPTPADNVRANKRGNETKYDQIVSNALQAKRRLCRDGLLDRVADGHFRLTAAGEAYRKRRRQDLDAANAAFDELFPDRLA